MTSSARNLLVMQSGGPTPVINRSLYGVISEAGSDSRVGRILGARHGIEGVLKDEIVDLTSLSADLLKRVAAMPAAALGSTRHSLASEEMDDVMKRLDALRIGYLLPIGGNDSAETGHRIAEAASGAGLKLNVVHVPKTIDNDLVGTDHTPGFGSAARFVALATLGAGLEAEAMKRAAPITIIEVMGRDAGWLAASAALARYDERDAPHVLGLPEVEVDEERLLAAIEDAYRRHGFAVAVVAENIRTSEGVVGGGAEPYHVDAFGHEYFQSPASYLARRLMERLGVRVRDEKPGTIQRSFIPAVSPVDAREAEDTGRAAVRYALEGRTDIMAALERSPERPYSCATVSVPLAAVAGAVKAMPPDFLDPGEYQVTDAFLDYARPLIGDPIPPPARLF